MVMTLEVMMAENETKNNQVASLLTQLDSATASASESDTKVVSLQAQLDSAKESASDSDRISDDLAIALIVLVSVMLLLTSLTLVILILKEKKGAPVFAPGSPVVTGTPCTADGQPGETFGNPAGKACEAI
jgi:hypothetical protein